MNRVEVKPELLRWARERAGLDVDALARRFPKLPAWESGDLHPTLKQLEGFAKATFTPVGFLFLDEPPEERVPIPDFRTVANVHVGLRAPICWTRSTSANTARTGTVTSRAIAEEPLALVGSDSSGRGTSPRPDVPASIRHDARASISRSGAELPTWERSAAASRRVAPRRSASW